MTILTILSLYVASVIISGFIFISADLIESVYIKASSTFRMKRMISIRVSKSTPFENFDKIPIDRDLERRYNG